MNFLHLLLHYTYFYITASTARTFILCCFYITTYFPHLILKIILLTSNFLPSEVPNVQASSFSFATLSTILSLTTNVYNNLF